MARYVVITPFADKYDSYHDYFVGDVFPHDGRVIPWERIRELTGYYNALGRPLIAIAENVVIPKPQKKVEKSVEKIEKVQETEESDDKPTYTKSEINRSTTERLKEIAGGIGIDGAEEKTGGELKKLIIDKLGL